MLKLPTKPNSASIKSNTTKTSDENTNNAQKSTIIKLENVRKTYANGAVGLRDVNIEIYKGGL